MTKRFSIFTKKVGLAPGHAVFTGEKRVEYVEIAWMRFGPRGVEQGDALSAADVPDPPPPGSRDVLWVNVDGLHDTELVTQVGEKFELHPLAIEDVVSVGGRPSTADYGSHLFTSLKMLTLGADGSVHSEHITIVFGPGWVLSFQETHGDVLGNVRRRIGDPAARVRSSGADYLWYALLDAFVDHYSVVLSQMGERIEDLEDEVWSEDMGQDLPYRAQEVRHELLVVRRAVRPLKEQMGLLTGDCPALITETTQPFLQDLEAHLLHHQDAIDHLRDAIASVLDAHVSIVTMRTNEVMRVLTIIASIFIPMTFVAGVYGMNFRYMPELDLPWAYPLAWAVMLGIGAALLGYFWRKNWL
ncbi:MAG TPA: magnesium/cobalt transporter CorA [Candidatus Limnocylindrales bacterium]|nr:magnesium/cobalt transporter CorA [Candidatus Limnocylindrales bacterium]